MIVVVEGVDRVGKTTLVKELEKVGFLVFKDEFLINGFQLPFQWDAHKFVDFSCGKLDSSVQMLKMLDKMGYNVVVDRLHLTEYVYGSCERGGTNGQYIFQLDSMLSKMGALLVYMRPTNIKWSSEQAGRDLGELSEYYDWVVNMSEMRVLRGDFYSIPKLLNDIMELSTKYDFYFASPFFNKEQLEREGRLIATIRALGFRVFSPRESSNLDNNSEHSMRSEVFNLNIAAIKASRAVFAVTDGKDVGTVWEAGYAFGANKPVIYYAETLGDKLFNLMLAESGRDVFTLQTDITHLSLANVLAGGTRSYGGNIE